MGVELYDQNLLAVLYDLFQNSGRLCFSVL
jgi:hypothetical protein